MTRPIVELDHSFKCLLVKKGSTSKIKIVYDLHKPKFVPLKIKIKLFFIYICFIFNTLWLILLLKSALFRTPLNSGVKNWNWCYTECSKNSTRFTSC